MRAKIKGAGNLLSKIPHKRKFLLKMKGCGLFSRAGYILEFTVYSMYFKALAQFHACIHMQHINKFEIDGGTILSNGTIVVVEVSEW